MICCLLRSDRCFEKPSAPKQEKLVFSKETEARPSAAGAGGASDVAAQFVLPMRNELLAFFTARTKYLLPFCYFCILRRKLGPSAVAA